MRILLAASACALALVSAHPARAQLFVTGVSANFPDGGGKLPGFNKVAGAAIPSWSSGLALGILNHGQSYEYCVSLASGYAKGTATVAYSITRGATAIQSAVIIADKDYSVVANGVWYWCAGYHVLPTSPGFAQLTATVTYTPTGSTNHIVNHLSVPLVLR
jgi:hypothetical protein